MTLNEFIAKHQGWGIDSMKYTAYILANIELYKKFKTKNSYYTLIVENKSVCIGCNQIINNTMTAIVDILGAYHSGCTVRPLLYTDHKSNKIKVNWAVFYKGIKE